MQFLKSLMLLASLCLFSTPVVVDHDPAVPGPDNPYCGKTASDFNPFVPTCPEGKTMNQACLQGCKDTYKTAMVNAYNTACTGYNDANTTYKMCAKLALQQYDTCLLGAHNVAEREACRDTCLASIANCLNTLNNSRNTIANNLANASANASSTFAACALGCCESN